MVARPRRAAGAASRAGGSRRRRARAARAAGPAARPPRRSAPRPRRRPCRRARAARCGSGSSIAWRSHARSSEIRRGPVRRAVVVPRVLAGAPLGDARRAAERDAERAHPVGSFVDELEEGHARTLYRARGLRRGSRRLRGRRAPACAGCRSARAGAAAPASMCSSPPSATSVAWSGRSVMPKLRGSSGATQVADLAVQLDPRAAVAGIEHRSPAGSAARRRAAGSSRRAARAA